MARWIALALLVVALSAGATVLVTRLPADSATGYPVAPRRTGPTGRVVIASGGDLMYRFGKMAAGTKDSHDWILENIGQADLELSKGSASCSCTIANFADNQKSSRLKPGRKTTITLTWDAKTPGPFEKYAEINTSDPRRPVLRFEVTGQVQAALTLIPPEPVLDFSNISAEEVHSTRYAIVSPDRPHFKVLDVRWSRHDLIDAKATPLTKEELRSLKAEGGYRIDIAIKPTSVLGAFRDDVIIETDHPLKKELTISVGGKTMGAISVTPEALRFNATEREGATAVVVLTVSGPRETKFEVETYKLPEAVKAEVAPVDLKTQAGGKAAKVRQYRLVVTVPPGTPAGILSGQVRLKTDDPRASLVKVPVHVSVQGD